MSGVFILGTISAFSVLIPLVTGAIVFRRLKPEMKLLVLLFLVTLLTEVYGFTKFIKKEDTHLLQHVYTPLEYWLFLWTFSYWQESRILKTVMRASIPVFLLICVISIIMLPTLYELNSFTASFASAIYVMISAYTLFLIQKRTVGSILGDCRFWISSSLLLYSAGSIVYFAFHDVIFSKGIWASHAVINITANTLFAVGFICQCRQQVK